MRLFALGLALQEFLLKVVGPIGRKVDLLALSSNLLLGVAHFVAVRFHLALKLGNKSARFF